VPFGRAVLRAVADERAVAETPSLLAAYRGPVRDAGLTSSRSDVVAVDSFMSARTRGSRVLALGSLRARGS